MDTAPMTPAGYKKLQDELRQLKTVERAKNIGDIETALDHGDLKENAEYHAAKEKQAVIAAQIKYFEGRLAIAEVIDPKENAGQSKIIFGATVTLYDINEDIETIYMIVGDDESDVKEGKIGISSPIARGLIGKNQDDEVAIQTPKGKREFEIVKIEYI